MDISGYWTDAQINDTINIYMKSTKLKEGQYCFGFQSNGKFIERKNSGWCGTPPIAYGDFEGSWSINDSIVEISVPFWGGTAEYKWKILSLDNFKLKYTVLEAEYNHDE